MQMTRPNIATPLSRTYWHRSHWNAVKSTLRLQKKLFLRWKTINKSSSYQIITREVETKRQTLEKEPLNSRVRRFVLSRSPLVPVWTGTSHASTGFPVFGKETPACKSIFHQVKQAQLIDTTVIATPKLNHDRKQRATVTSWSVGAESDCYSQKIAKRFVLRCHVFWASSHAVQVLTTAWLHDKSIFQKDGKHAGQTGSSRSAQSKQTFPVKLLP